MASKTYIIRYKRHQKYNKFGRIELNKGVVAVSIIISIVTLAWFIRYFTSSGGLLRNLSSSLINFKLLKRNAEISLPGILNLLIKITASISFIVVLTFVNNSVCKKLNMVDYLSLVCPFLYCLVCLFNTTRGLILTLAVGVFAAWYVIWHRLRSRKYVIEWRFIKRGIQLVLILLILFWLYAIFRNRGTNTNLDFGFMTYICNYVSGALAALDVYFKIGGIECHWFGEETFVTLNNNLHSLFSITEASTRVLEYRSYSGYQVVNIYTTFRRLFHDFGWIGVVLLPAIQGYISSKAYRYLKTKKYDVSVDFALVFYCYYFITIIYVAMEDTFFSSEVSLSGILKVIVLHAVYKFMFYKAKHERKII